MAIQLTQHKIDAAEQVIQIFKKNFISSLSSTDPSFPLQLWDQPSPQAQDTLNMLQKVRCNTKKSAYKILEAFITSNAPTGWKVILHKPACIQIL